MSDSEVTGKAAENLPAHGITSRHYVPSTGTRGIDVADAFGRPAGHGADRRPAGTAQPTSSARTPEARSTTGEARHATGEGRSSTGLEKVTAAVVAAARVQPGDRVIDLGCGSGQVSLELAERGAHVLAVDGHQALVSQLTQIAQARSLPGLEVLTRPLDSLSLP